MSGRARRGCGGRGLAGRLAPLLACCALATRAAGAPVRPPAAADVPDGRRAVAFTFDDLPASRAGSLEDVRDITARLLGHLERDRIPAIGFVNEVKLEVPGEEAAREALLAAWLDAGHDLGNHTYSHRRLYDTPLREFEADVLRGERVTRRLLAARGRPLRYFRHPTLNTGRDSRTRAAFERFLAAHGYLVAPVTIDNDEYLHAAAYDRARARGDRTVMRRVGEDYLRYMRDVFAFYERLSREVLGRELPQILLLHANALNAEYVDDLAAMARARGYRFVPLREALADPAYRQPDRYVGPRGVSWLQRWASTRGHAWQEQPAAPAWIREAARGS